MNNSEIFNEYTAHWMSRVESTNHSVILISGGIMSITIGAFLTSNPPLLDPWAASVIRSAWVLLALSLASAVLLKFFLVISGALTLTELEGKTTKGEEGVANSPRWLRVVAWCFGITAVSACLVGFTSIAIGAGSLLAVG